MVVCKYFQQGTCRFGQYCRFEHVGGFAVGAQGAVNRGNGDNKSIVLGVAEEVLAAERGGQWLLSCFGPFKEGACIVGMDDVSPEEVRWEMYQAQKTSTVDQTKLQFQQLCQAMTAKREALKNPTHETADMLDKLQKLNRDSSFSPKSNFILSTPQLGAPIPGVFAAKKSFGTTSGAFADGFNSTPVSQPSIFGRSSGTTSFFGAAPAFGAFAPPQASNSIFGGATKTTASVFGGGTTVASSSIFSSQSGQLGTSAPFGSASQGMNVFGGGTSVQQTGQSVFGGGSTTIFGQAKSTVAFGSAPVFGGSGGGFAVAGTGAVFGGQGTFTGSGSAFGQTTANSSFGVAPNSFATLATPGQPLLTSASNPPLFGNNSNALSSGETYAFANPGVTTSGVFGVPANTNVPAPFGNTIEPPEKFGNTTNSSPFISTTSAAPANNPFLQRSQVPSESFGRSPFSGASGNEAYDESIYSTEEDLSEDDKSSFLANVFILRNIPIKPPTIEIR